jgi:hypothetical protein
MRTVLDAYPDRVLIGEIYLPVEHVVIAPWRLTRPYVRAMT